MKSFYTTITGRILTRGQISNLELTSGVIWSPDSFLMYDLLPFVFQILPQINDVTYIFAAAINKWRPTQ